MVDEIKIGRSLSRVHGQLLYADRALRPGPWHDEPDHVDFEHDGLACILHRGPLGAWCGYVAVPPGHPWHGKNYSDLTDPWPEVHGGLTYSERCQGEICHVAKPGEPDDVWWLGFDCNHCDDISLSDFHFADDPKWPDCFRDPERGGARQYRTVDYARGRTERLAEQVRRHA